MSVPSLTWAWSVTGITATQKSVLAGLAWHSNGFGEEARPGEGRMAEMTMLSTRTIRSTYRQLVTAGLIEQTGVWYRNTPIFRLNLDRTEPWPEAEQTGERIRSDEPARPEADDTGPETHRSQTGNSPQPDRKSGVARVERAVERTEKGQERTAVEQVWDHYVEIQQPRRTEIDPETEKIIRDALRLATVEECCKAIDGNRASAYHQGENENGKKYRTVSHILKGKRGGRTTREQIDMFIDLAEKAPPGSGVSSDRVFQMQVAVRDAHEFPTDEIVVQRGDDAEVWLRVHGVETIRDDAGYPTFETFT